MTQLILFNVTNGLIIGAFYVLMALGLSLILNLSNVINFAHGNFLALGGYLAFALSPTLGYWGTLVVSPFLTALIGLIVERLMIRRIYGRDPVYSLLLTFGLAFVMQDAARYIWGPNGLPLGLPAVLSQPITPDLFFITYYRIFMVTVVIVAVIALFAFMRYTRGMAAALTTVFYPAASEAVIYAILMAVLLIRPRGLVGEEGMLS
ncbi:MAG: branched-chain amino acid ABC transporter permease [Xanthobacteraceae bacterium]